MNDEQLLAVLKAVADDDGLSLAKAAKKLSLSQSQLLRLLTMLGGDERIGGLNWLELREGEPPRIYLTESGRRCLEQDR